MSSTGEDKFPQNKIDGRKTDAFRQAARTRALAQWTPAARQAQSELTRAKMTAPAVRRKISDGVRKSLDDPQHVTRVNTALSRPEVRDAISRGTRAGIARWQARQLAGLREAWATADVRVRKQFLSEIAATAAIKPASISVFDSLRDLAGAKPISESVFER